MHFGSRRYLPTLAMLFAAILVAACASGPTAAPAPSPMSSPEACAANNGVWVAFTDIFPGATSDYDKRRFICNLRTTDAGRACTDRRQCAGPCLAPPGAKPGQEAVGTCSDHIQLVEGTRTITQGRVDFPFVSLEVTDDKRERLHELAENKARWGSYAVQSYVMTLSQSCFCFSVPAFGPNRIVVKNGRVVSVTYQGARSRGYQRGDWLTGDQSALRSTVEELFQSLEVAITRMTSNTDLRVQYDSHYGFPSYISFDRPDMEDEEYTLTLTDFHVK
jgi:hypothetical protein